MKKISVALPALVLLFAVLSGVASAITVTETQSTTALTAALVGEGSTGIKPGTATVVLKGCAGGGAVSSGTFTNSSGTYGIPGGVVLSTGRARDYGDGENLSVFFGRSYMYGVDATAEQEALLTPVTGTTKHRDVTQLDMTFDVQPGVDRVSVSLVFGSEEFQSGLKPFGDGFAVYLNGVNIALVDSKPVTGRHAKMAAVTGTELGGVLSGSQDPRGPCVFTFSGPAKATGNKLTFILADAGDRTTDSTVYIAPIVVAAAQPPALTFRASLAAGQDWVYQNTPVITADRHASRLSVTVLSEAVAGEGYRLEVTEPTPGGNVSVRLTANPLVVDLVGGRINASVPRREPYVLTVRLTGLQSGQSVTAEVPLQLRALGDVTGDGLITAEDKLALNQALNGRPTPEPRRALDLDGDGLVNAADKLLVNTLLNGLEVK